MNFFTNFIRANDLRILMWMNRRLRCRSMDIIMQSATQLGSLIFAILLPIILLISGKESLTAAGMRIIAVLTVSQLLVHLIKRVINRPRPFKVFKEIIAKWPPTCKYSFPSGHTCAAFSLAFVLAQSLPGLSLVLFPLASLVGLSRIYLGAHYPTDVFIGYLVAHASFLLL